MFDYLNCISLVQRNFVNGKTYSIVLKSGCDEITTSLCLNRQFEQCQIKSPIYYSNTHLQLPGVEIENVMARINNPLSGTGYLEVIINKKYYYSFEYKEESSTVHMTNYFLEKEKMNMKDISEVSTKNLEIKFENGSLNIYQVCPNDERRLLLNNEPNLIYNFWRIRDILKNIQKITWSCSYAYGMANLSSLQFNIFESENKYYTVQVLIEKPISNNFTIDLSKLDEVGRAIPEIINNNSKIKENLFYEILKEQAEHFGPALIKQIQMGVPSKVYEDRFNNFHKIIKEKLSEDIANSFLSDIKKEIGNAIRKKCISCLENGNFENHIAWFGHIDFFLQ